MMDGLQLTEQLAAKRKAKMQRENLDDIASLTEYELASLIESLKATVALAETTLRWKRLAQS